MSQYLDWKVGDRVVCLSIPWPDIAADVVAQGCRLPEPGQVYTIREIGVCPFDGDVYVRLQEIQNPSVTVHPWPDGEPRFRARRFRKVQPRKTDISIFTALLNGAKERERA